MALDVGRWLKYAQAKLTRAVDDGNAELDQLEAERAERIADQPWLASDGETPTFDEAKARIEHEAQRQASGGQASPPDGPPSPGSAESAPEEPVGTEAEDPEVAAARIELDRRSREAAARLDAIREELGVGRDEGDGGDPPSPS